MSLLCECGVVDKTHGQHARVKRVAIDGSGNYQSLRRGGRAGVEGNRALVERASAAILPDPASRPPRSTARTARRAAGEERPTPSVPRPRRARAQQGRHNRAQVRRRLWRIATVRLTVDERTIAYAQRRRSEGDTPRL